MAKKAYFIGLAGKTMAPLAKAFKDWGWEVSGSDQEKIYPPVTDYLKKNKILCQKGYRPDNLSFVPDLIVVGRSALIVDPQNPEYLKAKTLGCPVLSYPEVLQKYLLKKNSVVVAGTYGKTTLTALIAWILLKAGLNPSYMIGGVPLNMADGVKITDSSWSVVEGDETPALWENDPPKFMYYQPKFLLFTATKWDHPEIFKTAKDYQQAFVNLARLLPADGLLVYNWENVEKEIVQTAAGRKISYSFDNQQADWLVKDFSFLPEKTVFKIQGKGKELQLKTTLLGKHNLENICGAVALALEIGIEEKAILSAVQTFKGVKTRLEFLGKFGGRYLFWDFAQHPEKVKGSLEALRERFPSQKIISVFDPSMTGLKYSESLDWYQEAFAKANQVIVSKVSFIKKVGKENRVSGKDIVSAIAKTQPQVFYEPLDEKIIKWLLEKTKQDDIIVFMSSGGLRFTRLIEDTINGLKEPKN